MSNSKILETLQSETAPLFAKRNYHFLKTQWDDCARFKGSISGSNIADWSYVLKDGTTVPGLRGPNFEDQTLCIRASKIGIVVGNHTYGGNLKLVSFQEYLENYGKYTPGVPDSVNLSTGKDELVTIRFMAFILPVDSSGRTEVVPTVYSYGTHDAMDPQNFVGISSHFGTGTHTNTSDKQRIFLVEPKSDGTFDDSWIRVTSADSESKEEEEVVGGNIGVQSTGSGRNSILCFQIPRKQSDPDDGCIISKGGKGPSPISQPIFRCAQVGNVSYGSTEKKHETKKLESYERNPNEHVTLTCSLYFTTSDGKLGASEAEMIMNYLEECYQDPEGLWRGSLPTGERMDDGPPIQLASPKQEVRQVYSEKKMPNRPITQNELGGL